MTCFDLKIFIKQEIIHYVNEKLAWSLVCSTVTVQATGALVDYSRDSVCPMWLQFISQQMQEQSPSGIPILLQESRI